jgi:glyoxylase-like metal-dependent hydrolase (beta-lactamase superfamily II)
LRAAGNVEAIVATHSHEEHIGSTPLAQRITGASVYGTVITLAAVAEPERLSTARRLFIGQPAKTHSQNLVRLGTRLRTPLVELEVIESPGHCAGHASLFERSSGILFAGDSFLHEVFTCPNKDVSGDAWIGTLERYAQLPIRTMIGTHGDIFSIDEAFARRRFVVQHRAPLSLIQDKLTFLRWARAVVAEGERRGLPYGVIEAVLFPWTRWWAWATWFRDEGSRLFSAGEFSRTHFVRSLSVTPLRVPPRFPPVARLSRWLRGAR